MDSIPWEKAQLTAEEKPHCVLGKNHPDGGAGPAARRKMRRPHLTLAEQQDGVRISFFAVEAAHAALALDEGRCRE